MYHAREGREMDEKFWCENEKEEYRQEQIVVDGE
jgi:hypothetical protein